MKLELKHLSIAFANNYKVTYFDDERELNQVCNIVELREDECTISNGEYEYDVKFDDIKLLCFPLSALTKEMYYKLSGKNENDDFGFFYGKNNGDFDKRDYIYKQGYSGRTYMLEDGYYQFPYEMIDFLFKNKFDVFGLIDSGLAEPVTEEFNHYK